ncbi:MAG: sigma-70 family RNA polymerase sigma factor [Armatimonadaceae bacterium]
MTVAEITDELLIQRTLDGDTSAFDELVRRHGTRLQRFIQRFVRDQDTVEDIYIEAWGRAFDRLDTFRAEDARFTTWLFQIARNLARNDFRFRMRRRVESLDTGRRNPKDGEEYTIEIPDEDSDPGQTVPEEAHQEEVRAALRQAIEDLPESYREVIVLYRLQERSYEEIAEMLDMKEGAVRTRVCRATDRLRKMLSERYPEWER